MITNDVEQEKFSDEDWLTRFENNQTQYCAVTALNTFDHYCQKQIELNGKSRDTMIAKYQTWFNQDKIDIRSICFVTWQVC